MAFDPDAYLAAPKPKAIQPEQQFGTDIPLWGRKYPALYGIAGAMRETLGVPLEGLAAASGAVLGAGGGPVGSVVGGGLGYGIGKGITRMADEALGNAAPVSAGEGVMRAAGDVATGATMEGGGQIVAPYVAKGLGWVGDRVVGPSLAKLRAKQVMIDASGGKDFAVRQAVSQARPGITAGQAVEEAGINAPALQAAQVMAAKNQSTHFSDVAKGQAAARMNNLAAVTPNVKAAEAARSAVVDPLYDAAKAEVMTMTPKMADLFERMPEGVLAHAAEIAKIKGRPFQLGNYSPAQTVPSSILDASGQPMGYTTIPAQLPQLPGETLHFIKLALSDMGSSAPTKEIPKSVQRASQELLGEFLPEFEKAVTGIPKYGAARKSFETLSKPVNQGELLNNLSSILKNPGTGERAVPYLNALGRGEDAALKGAGLNPKFGTIEETLTMPQFKTVTKVADELTRDASMAKSATKGNAEFAKILTQDTGSLRKMIPNVLNRSVSIATKGLDLAEAQIGKKTVEALSEAMKSGKNLSDLFKTIPMTERNKILKAMVARDPTLKAKFATLLPQVAVVNALSPNENQNALAD